MAIVETHLLIIEAAGQEMAVDPGQVCGLLEARGGRHSLSRPEGGVDTILTAEGRVPVVDLVSRMGLSAGGENGHLAICVRTAAGTMAFLINRADDLVDVAPDDVTPLPSLIRAAGPPPFIRGTVRHQGRVLLLADLGAVLGVQEVRRLYELMARPDPADESNGGGNA